MILQALPLSLALLALAAPPPPGGVVEAEMSDDGPEEDDAQQRFEAALAQARSGKADPAQAALRLLARELPDEDLAPEALYEAGQLLEDPLRRPREALAVYEDLLQRYPQSRLWSRASARQAELSVGLRSGEEVYLHFQDTLAQGADREKVAARLRELLARHPDFAFADRARFLLGSALSDLHRDQEAEATLSALSREQPQSDWAARGELLLAQIALARGDFRLARERFAALSGRGPAYAAASAQGLQVTGQRARLHYLAVGSAAYLLILFLYLLWQGRGHFMPVPLEVLYYLPVAGFLILTAVLTTSGLFRALALLALSGAALSWLGGAAAKGLVARSRRLVLAGLAGGGLRLLGAAALCYLIVYHHGLWELVAETLKNGPER